MQSLSLSDNVNPGFSAFKIPQLFEQILVKERAK